MDAAKSAVKKFTSKGGSHDTSIHENVAPAVQHEQVVPTQHERSTTALDKEVHQDHFHTTEQPVKHSETLPEQHHHNLVATQERSFEHDSKDDTKRRVADVQSQYKNHSTRVEGGERTTSAQPTVAGEHVHHHVYETIQPVVQKQTVEPHVVHTTVPVHEVHHNETKHHNTTALPAMSMDEFKNMGGSLKGREERKDHFDGCPPDIIAGANGGHSGTASTSKSTVPSGVDSSRGLDSTRGIDSTRGVDSSRNVGSNAYDSTTSSSVPSNTTGTASAPAHHSDGPFNSHKHEHPQPGSYGNDMHVKTTSSSKPSLMDKLNPSKDANGDGKPGFMK